MSKDEYRECFKISNTHLFLFSNKMLAIRAGILKKPSRIANREDPDKTASGQSDLGLCCLSVFFWNIENPEMSKDKYRKCSKITNTFLFLPFCSQIQCWLSGLVLSKYLAE